MPGEIALKVDSATCGIDLVVDPVLDDIDFVINFVLVDSMFDKIDSVDTDIVEIMLVDAKAVEG